MQTKCMRQIEEEEEENSSDKTEENKNIEMLYKTTL